ncbi:hypothetical protein HHI36_022290 [Cryptolaemus montrouzieri]|uniref:Uncharacterized protein n=1 Tax=Cryptolaemus montrouzieri TaxID=559131 RepID=A0ABD2N043_9CUCU
MSPRANFHFLADALDAKTTVVRVLTIQLEGEDTIFQFPREQQLKEHHPALFGTTIVKNVIKGLKIRGKFRNIRITLADELQQEYLDKEGNVCFHDQYLDEVQGYVNPYPTAPQISRTNLDTNKPIHSVFASRLRAKKLNLLIDADPELTANSQMNFIVLGLPTDVRLRIDKYDLLSRDALMSRIRQLEPLVVNNDKKMNSSRNDRFNVVGNSERVGNTSGGELKYKKLNRQVLKPSSHCAVKGFPNRFHPENTCRNFINNTKRNYKMI